MLISGAERCSNGTVTPSLGARGMGVTQEGGGGWMGAWFHWFPLGLFMSPRWYSGMTRVAVESDEKAVQAD